MVGVGLRVVLACALALAAAVLPARAVADQDRSALEQKRAAIVDRVANVRQFLGADLTNDVIVRLLDDEGYAREAAPENYERADWDETAANVLRLDLELADQTLAEAPLPLAEIRGLHETFIRVADGTLQPVAVFVPPTYDPSKRYSLVIALHGRPQSEAELLGQPFLRRLAAASATIVVAPWGRGNYDFAEPAASEVYDAVSAAEHAFSIDRHKIFLVGYSMGGFSVFSVAPLHADRWAGIMSISGAMANGTMRNFVARCRNVNLYIVNGAEDTSIPPSYGEQTAEVLRGAGLAVGFYQEPHGKHELRTLTRSLLTAWRDMLAGRAVRSLQDNGPSGSGGMRYPI